MYELPTHNDISPDFEYTITIDEIDIKLRFIWNARCSCWVLNHYQEIDEDINFYNIRVKPYYNLLENLATEDAVCSLKGALMVMFYGDDAEITYESFGDVHKLMYLTEDEYEEWNTTIGL